MTALPPIADLTDADTTEAEAKTWFTNIRSFLSGLFGTDGTKATARKTLLEPSATTGYVLTSNGSSSDPTWQAVSSGPSNYFVASLTSQILNETGDGTDYNIVGYTETIDTGNNFASGIFVTPSNNNYYFYASVTLSSTDTAGATSAELSIDVDGAIYRFYDAIPSTYTGIHTIQGQILCFLASGKNVKVKVKVSGGSKTVDIDASYFFGWQTS
jgi:hypothetical protein